MNSFVRSFPNLRSFYHGSATRTAIYIGLFVLMPGLIVGLFAAQAGRAALAAGEVPSGIYFSSTTDGTVGGVAFADEDILRFDSSSGTWSMFIDGSDVGLGAVDIDAFEVLSNGDILLSPDATLTLPVVGAVDDSDIVRFVPNSTGDTTTGTYNLYFDGSDVELTTDAEDIDGVAFAPDGRLLISVTGKAVVTGVTALDEDILAFNMTSEGADTAGTWSMYFDGSDVGLSQTADEDVGGVWSDPATSELYLSTLGAFAVTGTSGQGSDVFICAPGSFGDTTSCNYCFFWDGAALGLMILGDWR